MTLDFFQLWINRARELAVTQVQPKEFREKVQWVKTLFHKRFRICNHSFVHTFQCDPFLRCFYFCIVGLDNTYNALNAMNVSTKKTIKSHLKKKVQKVRRTNKK